MKKLLPLSLLCLLGASLASCCKTIATAGSGDAPTLLSPDPAAYSVGPLLYADDFSDLSHWHPELEAPGTIRAHDHLLEIDVPRGCSLWLTRDLQGPLLIQYEAQMIQASPRGPNDRCSDLNNFWMATDPRAPTTADFFHVPQRTGAFATYNQLKTYYVGLGGDTNRTTRFRRYIGDASNRPLLPEHDLSAKEFLLTPNTWQTIQLVACGNLIEYYRDGRRIFTYTDPAPYTRGYFAFRTTFNHMQVRNLKIFRLRPPIPRGS
jgi:hypothetical protein